MVYLGTRLLFISKNLKADDTEVRYLYNIIYYILVYVENRYGANL